MTNLALKELLADEIMDEDVLNEMIVLEGDEFADGVAEVMTSDEQVLQ